MRRSKTTNTLVIVSDYTKGIYHDKWIGGVDAIMDNKFVPFSHPMFNQTADGKGDSYVHEVHKSTMTGEAREDSKGDSYVHEVRGADNLIGPPFEILSDKAVKHYEKMKDKGARMCILIR